MLSYKISIYEIPDKFVTVIFSGSTTDSTTTGSTTTMSASCRSCDDGWTAFSSDMSAFSDEFCNLYCGLLNLYQLASSFCLSTISL